MTAFIAQHHASQQLRQQQLQQQLAENQVDIYVLNTRELTDFWLTVQRQEGKTEAQSAALFEQLTGLALATALSQYGRDFGSATNDARVLAVLATDLQRGGRFFSTYRTVTQNGRQYIIFKGNHRARQVIKGTRYLASNTGLVKMAVGKEGLKQSAKSGFLVSVIFSLSLHSLQWLFEDEYRWTNWLAGISTDLVKIAIAGAAGYLVGMVPIVLAKGAVMAILPLGLGIIAALTAGYLLNELDRRLHLTTRLAYYLEQQEVKHMEPVKQRIYDGIYYLISSTVQAKKRQMSRAAMRRIQELTGIRPRIWN
ncbi:hypothetical protein [Alkalimonas amylolytica]|uniref:Uncharacterized protein n=1 Tax=Alkalimonas amylolytica TaxID=152573 RepID=A0A1H4CPM4_ALKAM|nr:hypothetical protein [Alkalimonas amylolytica]SEA62258.1 hypothetical protein SAMN04488051_104264 [Alkalimonas amylolytica]